MKKLTSEKTLYDALEDWEPKPARYDTLSDLFRNIQKEQMISKQEEEEEDEENDKDKPDLIKSEEVSFKTAAEVLRENEATDLELDIKGEKTPSRIKEEDDTNEKDHKSREENTKSSRRDKDTKRSGFCKASDLISIEKVEKTEKDRTRHHRRRKSSSSSSKWSVDESLKLDSETSNENDIKHTDKPTETPEEALERFYGENADKEPDSDKSDKTESSSGFELKMSDNVRKFLEEKYEIFDNMIKQSKLISEEMEKQEKARKEEQKSRMKMKNLFGEETDSPDEVSAKRHRDRRLSGPSSSKQTPEHNKSGKNQTEISETRKRPPSKDDRLDDSKKIKLNKEETAEKQNNCKVKSKRLGKTEIGLLVVKLLTPAYADKRFDSRDTFKTMARTISHSLLDKGESNIFHNVVITVWYFQTRLKSRNSSLTS